MQILMMVSGRVGVGPSSTSPFNAEYRRPVNSPRDQFPTMNAPHSPTAAGHLSTSDPATNGHHGASPKLNGSGNAPARAAVAPALSHRMRHTKSILAIVVSATHIFAGTQAGEILVCRTDRIFIMRSLHTMQGL